MAASLFWRTLFAGTHPMSICRQRKARPKMTDQESEDLRREILKDLELGEGFIPDPLHVHEALHTASILLDLVDRQLLSAPAIASNPDHFSKAVQAHQALFDLYQAIGNDRS